MIVSAGLILFRRMPSLELLVAHLGGPYWKRKDAQAWTFPKGVCEEGEDEFAAARREFAEEIGSPAPDVDYLDLGTVRQSSKTVRLWAGEADFDVSNVSSNTFELEWPPRSGTKRAFPEVDRAAWVSPDVARVKLVAAQLPFVDRIVAAVAS